MEQPRATRSAMKASREVVVEDGFKYKRRKSGATQGGRQSGGAGRVPVAPPAVARGSRKSVNLDELGARSSLPADYPGLTIHENVPEDLPEEERLQQLVEEICEAECRVERERLIREFGSADGAAMAASLEAAMSEFQLKVEELIVRGDVQFDASTTALREMRDAKEEAMRAVATQLEDESAQWSALEDAVRSGSSPRMTRRWRRRVGTRRRRPRRSKRFSPRSRRRRARRCPGKWRSAWRRRNDGWRCRRRD